jgi:hypothetical protein
MMFDNQRYITRGIESEVPLWLQNLIWYMIDSMESEEKDYLQVFNLSPDNGKQKIIHTQEQPPYKKEFTFDADEPVTAKIFVIDDETHSTMLLAEEY